MTIDLVRERTLAAPADVIAFAKQNGIKMVDMKFVDLPGT